MHIIDSLKLNKVLQGFPYFVINKEITKGVNLYKKEIQDIKQHYIDYESGADFQPEGSSGDYIPTYYKFRLINTLINKEARFMFSQEPKLTIKSLNIQSDVDVEQVKDYQKLVNKVFENSSFQKYLLQSAKDCFIGKRIAMLVDISEDDGILVHFYSSLQFYYETDTDSDRLTKFVTFVCTTESKVTSEREYLVNRYEEKEDGIYMSSIIYDGAGNIIEEIIPEKAIDLSYIPAVVIVNDGTLERKRGISEVELLSDGESFFSFLGSGDIDSERKGMNPIRYVVDMNSRTTKDLSSSAGSFWELKSEQNQDQTHPMVGILAPQMNHVEAVKTTMNRIKSEMYNMVDVPDISNEVLQGTITSGKTIGALYFPLKVRCDEKMKTWRPSLERIVKTIIDIALLNEQEVKGFYALSNFKEVQFTVNIQEHYALLEDEQEEKSIDLQEVAQNTRSKKSYIKKWRKDEFETDEQIDEELLQIAMEQNMFDVSGMSATVNSRIKQEETEIEKQNNIEEIENILE